MGLTGQAQFTRYFDTVHVALGSCVVPPGGQAIWDTDAACRAIVAARDGWTADGQDLPALFPVVRGPDPVRVGNASGKVGLVFTLALSDQATLLFFGSRAAGTHSAASDVDLLVIAPDCVYDSHTQGRMSLYTVSPEVAQARCARGDLFFGRLLQTARVLYDPCGRVDALAGVFVPAREPVALRQAAAVGTLLVSGDLQARMPEVILPRTLWCVRTVLLAEGRNPFEGEAALSEPDRVLHQMLRAARAGGAVDAGAALAGFAAFLQARGLVEADWLTRGLAEWAARFAADGNTAGIKTVLAMMQAERQAARQRPRGQGVTTAGSAPRSSR